MPVLAGFSLIKGEFCLLRKPRVFAAQVRATLTSQSPRPWHDVDRDEIKAILGMMMATAMDILVYLTSTAHTQAKKVDVTAEVSADLTVHTPQRQQ